MEDIYQELERLKDGLTHSKSKKEFYVNFNKTIGRYPTLALLGLISRSNVSLAEVRMIAYISELYTPITLVNYNADINGQPNVCFSGVAGRYKIRLEMQFKVLNPQTKRFLHPDLKLTLAQYHKKYENDIISIAVEYEGHSSHTDPHKVKTAFLRNREISYQIGGPVLPYYKEELDSKDSRNVILNRLRLFIKEKIKSFELAVEFARKVENTHNHPNDSLVCCPVCEGMEKIENDFCPQCKGLGRVRKNELQSIHLDDYESFDCAICSGKGCTRCGFRGFLSREKAIEVALETYSS